MHRDPGDLMLLIGPKLRDECSVMGAVVATQQREALRNKVKELKYSIPFFQFVKGHSFANECRCALKQLQTRVNETVLPHQLTLLLKNF